jgi:hypothetical protein
MLLHVLLCRANINNDLITFGHPAFGKKKKHVMLSLVLLNAIF